MAPSHERRNLPQMYRRFETICARKIKESGSGRHRRVVGEEKDKKRNFLNHRFSGSTRLRIWEVD
jgi:hypothetical protein